MIIVVERKDEIHLKLNKKIEQEGIKGGFEDSTERENKLNLQTKWVETHLSRELLSFACNLQ